MGTARGLLLSSLAIFSFALAGCGEKVQTLSATERKVDSQAWQNNDTRYLAPGWKPGDQNSWNSHLVDRAQGQNDYAPRK
jgi:hypothetical protein